MSLAILKAAEPCSQTIRYLHRAVWSFRQFALYHSYRQVT